MSKKITESRFYMWRAIFAMAHADGIVTAEESEFMTEYLEHVDFSDAQRKILEEDMRSQQSVPDMFAKITEQSDRSQFFYFARLLAWCDGDFDAQEQAILDKLKVSHLAGLDMELISKSVRDSALLVAEDIKEKGVASTNFWENVRKFQDNFDQGKS
ncbi:MAG: TerB family tellurite resistance protein [Alphaproteobacteria bacterium]|nr:TerB family tellurite resistance protein [Alphaproteobacteria bacterium]